MWISKEKYEKLIHQNETLIDECRMLKEEISEKSKSLGKTNKILNEQMQQYAELLNENQKLKRKNDVLSQYYRLDQDPSEEIMAKIHVDLEVDRLKERVRELTNHASSISLAYQNTLQRQQADILWGNAMNVYRFSAYYPLYPFGCGTPGGCCF